MVKIRLRRRGRKKYPFYDIVAVDIRARRDGAYLDRFGYYNPNTNPNTIEIDHAKAIKWLNVGAQPTDIVERIMSYEGILLRRHLQFKGKSEEEIEAEVEKHKEVAKSRYTRRKDLRVKRKAVRAKEKEEADKKAAEEKAAAKK